LRPADPLFSGQKKRQKQSSVHLLLLLSLGAQPFCWFLVWHACSRVSGPSLFHFFFSQHSRREPLILISVPLGGRGRASLVILYHYLTLGTRVYCSSPKGFDWTHFYVYLDTMQREFLSHVSSFIRSFDISHRYFQGWKCFTITIQSSISRRFIINSPALMRITSDPP
jgi:hypothetical protein